MYLVPGSKLQGTLTLSSVQKLFIVENYQPSALTPCNRLIHLNKIWIYQHLYLNLSSSVIITVMLFTHKTLQIYTHKGLHNKHLLPLYLCLLHVEHQSGLLINMPKAQSTLHVITGMFSSFARNQAALFWITPKNFLQKFFSHLTSPDHIEYWNLL